MDQWSYTEKTAVKPVVNLHRGNFMESGKALFPMSWEKRGEGPKRSPVHNQFPHERGKREQIPRPEDSHRQPQWLLGYTMVPKHLWTISPNTRVPSWTGYRNKKPCPASEDKQNCQNDSFESPLWKAQIWACCPSFPGGRGQNHIPVSGIWHSFLGAGENYQNGSFESLHGFHPQLWGQYQTKIGLVAILRFFPGGKGRGILRTQFWALTYSPFNQLNIALVATFRQGSSFQWTPYLHHHWTDLQSSWKWKDRKTLWHNQTMKNLFPKE